MKTERKFTKGLQRPGMASKLRETVCQVVRESSVLNKPVLVEPIDFESFMVKNKTLIQNDPQRELLLYPNDDVAEIVQPRNYRTVSSGIPEVINHENGSIEPSTLVCHQSPKTEHVNGNSTTSKNDAGGAHQPPLLTRQAIRTYKSDNRLIQYKYSSYGGLSQDLPRQTSAADEFREEVYEVDADLDRIDEQMTRSQADTITKQGYLLKGPDTTSDRMFAHIGAKSFKKRYCYLRQEVDGTYILEVHKDERQGEAKTTIVMDFCTEVVQNPKRGRFCFELRMTAGHKSFTFAAENESDLQDWFTKLQSILQQNKLQEDKRAASLERAPPESPQTTAFGTLKGLEQSMSPQLIKYSRETDMSIAQARKENRKRLFASHQLPSHVSKVTIQADTCEPYKEQFGQRILLKCESLKFRLQAPTEDGEGTNQVEPYITSLALYDAKAGRKLTENFYFDLNHECVRDMIQLPRRCSTSDGVTAAVNGSMKHPVAEVNGCDDPLKKVPSEWLQKPKEAIFSVTSPNPDIFLVVKIDKILQGGINQSTEAYLKANRDPKIGSKVQKSVKAYWQKIGHFRMPFAWAARPLFRLYSSDLDVAVDFPAIYRQEGNKLRDEELLKLLAEYRKPDKFSKLTVIPGWLKITIEPISELPNNCLTTTLAPLKPFPLPPTKEPTQEISEFSGVSERDAFPFANFQNHLFIYPLTLNFDSQKLFSRARNIAVLIELRDSDTEGAKGLPCIYGRPGQSRFVSQISCPVLHHNTTPSWYEEIKLKLPLHIATQHHILFSFVHVSCDLSKKKENISFETPVGYAWLPLLTKGKINVEEQIIPVAATLPTGYLAIQPLGLGKGNAGPEIQWIDNQRPLFTVTFRLDSTVLTTDQHLHNLFVHAERLLEQVKPSAIPAESGTCKILKAAHAIHATTVITFLPTILNQLFVVLVNTSSEEIGLNIIRLLVNLIHMVAEEAGRKELLLSYVKYVFHAPSFGGKVAAGGSPSSRSTVHCELSRHLPKLLHPNNTDFLIVNKFMKYSGIFFDIIIKSMAQHLLATSRIKMQRNERFPKEFHTTLESLFQVLIPYIISRHKDLITETQALNKSLSIFVKKCLTFMDRGFVFKLIRMYMDRFSPGDPRTLQEFKFAFLQEVCSHEHYVPLNLPFILSPKNRPDILQHFTLSEEYCRQHFLAGLLLQEVKSALNEVGNTRRMAFTTLKELLAKHDLDNRYSGKGQVSRIAMLYIPWMGIVLENLHRIGDGSEKGGNSKGDLSRISTSSSYVFSRDSTLNGGVHINSTGSTPKTRNRLTLHADNHSPFRASLHLRDTTYFAAIAGQSLSNGHSTASLDSECSSLSQDTTVIRNVENSSDSSSRKGHNRSVSVTQPAALPRSDKFTPIETKDMLICFLFVVKHISQDQMTTWWQNCTETETIGFFTILELCLIHFKYVGKKNITLYDPVKEARQRVAKASTLPARMQPPNGEVMSHETGTMTHGNRENLVEETVRSQQALIESNMATEIGMIVLDCMGMYTVQFRNSIMDGGVLPKLAQVYLRFLQLGQSEALSMHVFSALRAFINNFSPALFRGTSVMCGQLVYELLKCCDSRLPSVRQESCAVLYLLMRSNFEFSGRKALTRVHLQVIISVSQMIGNVIGLNNARFQESLSLINSYASSDKAMKGTGFPLEVKDLTKRVRTVLMATAQMQAHQMDPERLLELQLSLANSYASTPELRHTWLVTMARNHEQHGNISEAACCNLHIAALMAEYLRLKGGGQVTYGAESFAKISRNIPRDERGLKLDSGAQDSQYTEQMLLDQLKECAEYLDRAERFECLGELYRLIIPLLENRRNYYDLAHCYEHLANVYNKIIEVNKSGRRLLGRFYRVAFFGQLYFEDDNGIEYVYKEPKLTSLSEISERLHKQYKDKFGPDVVKMIMDSCPVDASELDPKIAYIQVTHVIPYFCKDELDDRQNEFEQNHDVDTFMYETPFTKVGSVRGNVEDQWKRRTVLTTQYSFPYVLTRIPVKSRQITELTPIEVAVDEMQNRVAELEEVVLPPIDLKKLQLRLQGSVAVTVNAGPLAYASAFLDPKTNEKFPYERVEDLREVYRDFMRVCYTALQINGRLIMSDQKDYHKELERNYQNLCSALTDLLDESFFPSDETNSAHRTSLALFSAISGAPNNSSSA